MRAALELVLAASLVACAACHAPRPSQLPRDEPWIVAVKSCRLPTRMQWYTRFAHHTWIDVKAGDDQHWRRIEVSGQTTGVVIDSISAARAHSDWRWGREVQLHASISGERAQRISERIDGAASAYDELFADSYDAWPGPNSNTLLRRLAHDLPELAFAFDHNALGKDYALRIGLTPSKSGVSADAYVVGAALAAREGLELHALGLVLGVQFWPPRLQLPLLPELPWSAAPARVE